MDLSEFDFKKHHSLFMRNIVFGVEDSLVSTVGLLSGIAIAGVPKATIILSGIVLIFVEAFSMGVGSLLTEHSVEAFEKKEEVKMGSAFLGGAVMLISYLLSGIVPLFPYFFWEGSQAMYISIVASLVALFFLGYISGRLSGIKSIKHGIKMVVFGGIAIAIGMGLGRLVEISL